MTSTAAPRVLALRTILLATSLFLCAIKALAQTPSPALPGVNFERVLVIGTKDAPPFAMKDDRGEWTGLSIDLWKHIAEELHLRYRFKETTLQGLIDETAAGELDGAITALTVTDKREEVVDFTQPYYATGLGIAVAKHSIFDWWRLLRSLISPGFWVALLGLLDASATVLISALTARLLPTVNPLMAVAHPTSTRTPTAAPLIPVPPSILVRRHTDGIFRPPR